MLDLQLPIKVIKLCKNDVAKKPRQTAEASLYFREIVGFPGTEWVIIAEKTWEE